ncbi:MAG: hypothetical protein GY913_09000 [Proteobacteria bacterium]|nr:hypothetical protein [Pseudomonadota bacterium]MCP4917048.1 hypothetical protein [Pseudomonadota bacterium]
MTFDLGTPGVLRLTGADTVRYCNSMLTNDFRKLAVGEGSHSGMADPKGRLLGLLDAWRIGEEQALIVLDGPEPESTAERLDMYIIMDPIELEDLTSAYRVVHVLGGEGPESGIESFQGGWRARTDRLGEPGVDYILPLDEAAALLTDVATPEEYDRRRILNGLPRFPADFTDKSFVHEMNLRDRICAFDKGCYMGQEVINRMDTMGKVNKRLTTVELDAVGQIGATVTIDGDEVGTITSEAVDGDRVVGLGVLRKAAWEAGTALALSTGASGRTIAS